MRYGALLVVAALALDGCSGAAEQKAKPPPFKTELSMKDLMDRVIDPVSGKVWAASGTVVDMHGTTDLAPKTKEGWNAVANNAAVLAELANVLMLPGRAPGEPQWDDYANRLHTSAVAAMQAAERKDENGLVRTGGDIYDACTACHKRYVLGER